MDELPEDLVRRFIGLLDEFWVVRREIRSFDAVPLFTDPSRTKRLREIEDELNILVPTIESVVATLGLGSDLHGCAQPAIERVGLNDAFSNNADQAAVDGVRKLLLRCAAAAKARSIRVTKATPLSIAGRKSGTPRVFIGHGRSLQWHRLRDFIERELKLAVIEYNSESTAGRSRKERLTEMLDEASFAFLVMTAEDQHADGSVHARANVIHEIGLFQGRLGFEKAIVLIEVGCIEFSNLAGLEQIPFVKDDILSCSEAIRAVLAREGLRGPANVD